MLQSHALQLNSQILVQKAHTQIETATLMHATAKTRFCKDPYEVESILDISRYDSASEANRPADQESSKNRKPYEDSVLGELKGFEDQVSQTFMIRTDRPSDSQSENSGVRFAKEV